jgi:hypothetical protein
MVASAVMAQVQCSFCGAPASDRWREVVGWERLRDQGGQNHVVGRRETGRRACEVCIVDLRAGVAPGSPHLF